MPDHNVYILGFRFSLKNGGTKEVLITVLLLWFSNRVGVGCHDTTIPWSNQVSFPGPYSHHKKLS